MKTISGICVCAGIAAGLVRWEEGHIPAAGGGEPAGSQEELRRFEEAVCKVEQERIKLCDDVLKMSGEETAAIFQAHAIMLRDEILAGPVRGCISSGCSAAQAVRLSFGEAAPIFDQMDDEYMKARGDDIRDLEKALLRAMSADQPDPAPARTGKEAGPVLIAAVDFSPSEIASMDRENVLGIILQKGNTSGHAAIIARAMGIPMLVRCQEIDESCQGRRAVLDPEKGILYLDPDEDLFENAQKQMAVRLEKRNGQSQEPGSGRER